MNQARLIMGLSLYLVLCLLACHRNKASKIPLRKIDATQMEVLRKALDTIREDWNKGACQCVYDKADKSFRSQTLAEWESQCAQVRGLLGPWRGFTTSSAFSVASSDRVYFYLVESAVFGSTSRHIMVLWRLQNQKVKLSRIDIEDYYDRWLRMPPQPISGMDIDLPVRDFGYVRTG